MSGQTPGTDEGKLFAFLAYLLGIIGFIVVLVAKKDNRFAMFHAKQSLVLFFGWVIAGALHFVPIPFIGPLIGAVLYLLLLILWVMGMVYALGGQEKDLPIVGQIASQINI
jgi:uncharacterized membrane protein